MRSRIAGALAASTVVSVIFATHAFTRFTVERVKIVREPIADIQGRVAISAPASTARIPSPDAVIWKAQNNSTVALDLTLDVDGQTVCTRRLAPHASARFDCQDHRVDFYGSGHVVRFNGTASPWVLSYLEVATLHGRTSSPENLIFIPAGSRAYVRPSNAFIFTIWLALTLVLLVPPTQRPGRAAGVHRGLAVVVFVLLTVVSLSALLSSYSVIVSTRTFAQWLVILCARRFLAIVRWLGSPIGVGRAEWLRPWLRRAALASCVFLTFGTSVRYQLRHIYQGNVSGFLHISQEAFDRNPVLPDRAAIRPTLFLEATGGYDGQFVYFMTFDPLLRKFHENPGVYSLVVDAPPYRWARIGLSALTRLLAGSHWSWYPIVIVWLVWLALVAAALALSEIAVLYRRSPWLGALVLAVPGFWLSIGAGLPEPLAAALLITALYAVARGRWAMAALLCAASLLTRETGVICACTLLGYAVYRGYWKHALIVGGVALVPLALWRLYVGITLHSAWGMSAFFFDPNDIGLPFMGFRALWASVSRGDYYAGNWDMARAALTYPILLVAGLGLAITTTAASFNPCALAAIGYGVLAVSLRFENVWVYVGNGQRVTFELFVMLAVSSTQSAHWPQWLRRANGLFWILAVTYILFGSFHGGLTRQGFGEVLLD